MKHYTVTIQIPATFAVAVEAADRIEAHLKARALVEQYVSADGLSRDYHVDLDPDNMKVEVEGT